MEENPKYFNPDNKVIEWVKNHEELFLAACLLHDVGHAPFSHTSEEFYRPDEEEFKRLFANAINNDSKLITDKKKNQKAKAHEQMSVIVALKTFRSYFKKWSDEADFFARCITGYKYTDPGDIKTEKFMVKNCIIELLNSSIIDVDKLDYIIRDAFVSGFQSVNIDYNRLLEGIVIILENNIFKLAYHKSAISVIQNVLYAHDFSKEWIQTHPSIIYEDYLIEHCINNIERYFSSQNEIKNKLFSYDALTEKGIAFGDNPTGITNISLLSDSDILFFIKNMKQCQDPLTHEYFNRNSRRHPIWKSEDEFEFFTGIHKDGKILKAPEESGNIIEIFKGLEKLLEGFIKSGCEILPVIDEKLYKVMLVESKKDNSQIFEKDTLKKNIEYLKIIKEFAKEQEIPFDFIIRFRSKFISNFSAEKIDTKNIKIWYPHEPQIELTSRLKTLSAEDRADYFYLYYRRKEKNKKITVSDFCNLCDKLRSKYKELHKPI